MEGLAVPARLPWTAWRLNGIEWIVVCHLALLYCLVGWDRGHVVWQSASPAFVGHDIDLDQWISREEWEGRYGTSASSRAVLEFDLGDCDRDGRLAWQEFYSVTVIHRECGRASLETPLQHSGAAVVEGEPEPVIISDKDLELARVSLARTRQRLVAGKFHKHYTEEDWPTGEMYQHELTCREPEEIGIPAMSRDFLRLSHLAMVPRGRRIAIRCSLANRGRYTFTYLQLRVSVATGAGHFESLHGKTLWVPPREARSFWVLPAPGHAVTGVSVRTVRTQRASAAGATTGS